MPGFAGNPELRKIVVLNTKGGSGKTTLAFNVAGYLAGQGHRVALIDMDPQGSSTRWLRNRSDKLAAIRGIRPSRDTAAAAESPVIDVPADVDYAVIDAPAGLSCAQLIDYTCGAHAILLPVLPSDLDIHAASRLISDLLLVAKVSRRNGRLGIVANRVKERTIAYRQLQRFLDRLSIAVVGTLRDSQNYTWAAASGLCIHEMTESRAARDVEQWASVTTWLDDRLATPLTPRDWLRPQPLPLAATVTRARANRWDAAWIWMGTAAAGAAVVWLWGGGGLPGREENPHRVATASVIVEPNMAIPVAAPEPTLVSPFAAGVEDVTLAPTEIAAEATFVTLGEQLSEQWQLSGIARSGPLNVAMLQDRYGPATRRVTANVDLDGWVIADTGTDFVVLARDGERVRLDLVQAQAP